MVCQFGHKEQDSLENEDYTQFDVKSYLGKWEVNEGEVAVPASASELKYDNYQDVQKTLEDAGFTNIATANALRGQVRPKCFSCVADIPWD